MTFPHKITTSHQNIVKILIRDRLENDSKKTVGESESVIVCWVSHTVGGLRRQK